MIGLQWVKSNFCKKWPVNFGSIDIYDKLKVIFAMNNDILVHQLTNSFLTVNGQRVTCNEFRSISEKVRL